MAKKIETLFECASCGHESQKWLGRCPACNEWNSFKQVKQISASAGPGRSGLTTGRTTSDVGGAAIISAKALGDVGVQEGLRLSSGANEFDRVLGGGMLRGSSILLGGEPGIGKSTLTLQIAKHIATQHATARPAGPAHGKVATKSETGPVLYVAGEESAEQIKLRADRLGLDNATAQRAIHILASSHLDDIVQALVEIQPSFVIVDSVQTLFSPEAGSAPGSPTQIKYCVFQITEWCRQNYAAVLLIAHVTKEGIIAGPKLLEHMVDVVLYFEEAEAGLRVLRGYKNRYGSTDEIGLFSMGPHGLSEVTDPYSVLVEKREGDNPAGVSCSPVYEGSRILLVELQALTVPNKNGLSRVNSDRVDQRRVARIAAVLEKHVGLSFSDQEIYVNIAGGLKVIDVSLDLSLAMALFSARSGLPLPPHATILGEVSLSGEIRSVPHLRRRIQAAHDMGLTMIVGPTSREIKTAENWFPAKDIKDAIRILFKDGKNTSSK